MTATEGAGVLAAGFDIIQLEKFTPAEMAHAIVSAPPSADRLVAVGGVTAQNAADNGRAGATPPATSAP